jgi:hypothetical protein
VNVSEFGSGEALHVDVDLTTVHTLVRVRVHPSKQLTLQVCHKKNENWFTSTQVELVAIIIGASSYRCWSAGMQESYHEKLDLHIAK